MTKNYQKELDKILSCPETKGKTLLLHSCCAPCSSYALEYLRAHFRITVFFYNPNLTDRSEYLRRRDELKRLLALINDEASYTSGFQEGEYEPRRFYEFIGAEAAVYPEGGARCFKCYELRLRETARVAAAGGYDYFAATLTLSPLKNAEKINEIGNKLAEGALKYLPSDFKKKDGYKRSLELSKQYALYRQNYCGCEFSLS